MVQLLRALTAPAEDLGSISSTDMAAHNCLNSSSRGLDTLSWPLRAPQTHTHTHTLKKE